MPVTKPSGAWVAFPPKGRIIPSMSGPSEASAWRTLMADRKIDSRIVLEEMGYTVTWVEGATCKEYEGS